MDYGPNPYLDLWAGKKEFGKMKTEKNAMDKLINTLKERAKELHCLYQVEEILKKKETPLDALFAEIIDILPIGWSHPDICQAVIKYDNQIHHAPGYVKTEWFQQADILFQNMIVGKVEIFYLEERSFLKEEQKLIQNIADRISQVILHRHFGSFFLTQQKSKTDKKRYKDWRLILDLIKATDPELYLHLPRRMLNYLYYSGIEQAKEVFETKGQKWTAIVDNGFQDGTNKPLKKRIMEFTPQTTEVVFNLAKQHLSDEAIYTYIQKWLKESKFSFLINALEDHKSSLPDIINALQRYNPEDFRDPELPHSTLNAIKVSLIRRFFSRRLEVINLAKENIFISDFFSLMKNLICPVHSDGKIGGKSSGLFMAKEILKRESDRYEDLKEIKVPKTWYIASDGLIAFTNYNQLREMRGYKYHDINQIRVDYPNLVQLFKNSLFPPEMLKGLSVALDDFGRKPLIIRSSSLLEDSIGAAFSGKYKSLFIANQGTKKHRLEALLDAIAEVYASTYAPDPLEYRAERGLLDYQEEMGIMIQEVVGTKVDKYLFPAFGGVAFSSNEFRWSPRIKRKDGLIRLVPGMGTRAVDRLSNDFPILISPGQPGLRVNTTINETIRYAPKYMDVINLETNTFETIEIEKIVKNHGDVIPRFKQIFSICGTDSLKQPLGLVDYEKDFFVPTFEGLLKNSNFIRQVKRLLDVLEENYGTPIDIEFAADGQHLYLLQCRSQSFSAENAPVSLPLDIPPERVLFSASKYVSNGWAPDITHIVYVCPDGYDKLEDMTSLNAVGRAVSKLNIILPKRKFILVGPGRWGSRGDIKLGVNVTYSDIHNTSALIEVAFKKGTYQPDLSFGTHFFQDLVEASIRYLPLYPDDPENVFNHDYLNNSNNLLPLLLPQYAYLKDVIRVIDIPKTSNGDIAQLLMNGEEGKALCILTTPSPDSSKDLYERKRKPKLKLKHEDEHWKWRVRIAEQIAAALNPERFGVFAIYLFGSTNNGTAGPRSDIDLLVHFDGTSHQHKELNIWLEGWDRCLVEILHQRTGNNLNGLLDVHFITHSDIKNKTSWASRINAISDAARPLLLMDKNAG